jgi:hypothetical protein
MEANIKATVTTTLAMMNGLYMYMFTIDYEIFFLSKHYGHTKKNELEVKGTPPYIKNDFLFTLLINQFFRFRNSFKNFC